MGRRAGGGDLRAGPRARAGRGGGTGPGACLGPAARVRPRAQGAGAAAGLGLSAHTHARHRRPREGRRRTRGKEGAKGRPPRGLEGGSFAPLAPPRVSAPQRPRGEFPGWSHNSLHRSAPSAQYYFPGRPGHPRATAQVPTDSLGFPHARNPERLGSRFPIPWQPSIPPGRLGSRGRPKSLPLRS